MRLIDADGIDDSTVDAIPIEWIEEWMGYHNSWTTEGVKTLLREWTERKEERINNGK